MQIYMWWLDLDLKSKEWLQGTPPCRGAFRSLSCRESQKPGGPHPETPQSVLTDAEWDFIETQSEFVD